MPNNFRNNHGSAVASSYRGSVEPGHGVDRQPRLTPREVECLLWTSQGKTCADVAVILDIAEATARFYLNSARTKLNCMTIAHCVAKAISMQLIPPVC